VDSTDVLNVIHSRQGHESMALLLPHRSSDENLADNRGCWCKKSDGPTGLWRSPVPQHSWRRWTISHALVTSANLSHIRVTRDASLVTIAV